MHIDELAGSPKKEEDMVAGSKALKSIQKMAGKVGTPKSLMEAPQRTPMAAREYKDTLLWVWKCFHGLGWK